MANRKKREKEKLKELLDDGQIVPDKSDDKIQGVIFIQHTNTVSWPIISERN